MNHNAIRLVYPNVKTIDDAEGCFDFNNKKVEIDETLIEQKAQELQQQYIINKCKNDAKQLIANCDWAMLPDVNITNRAEFEAYRATLREFILNPVENPTFSVEPEPVWQ